MGKNREEKFFQKNPKNFFWTFSKYVGNQYIFILRYTWDAFGTFKRSKMRFCTPPSTFGLPLSKGPKYSKIERRNGFSKNFQKFFS